MIKINKTIKKKKKKIGKKTTKITILKLFVNFIC